MSLYGYRLSSVYIDKLCINGMSRPDLAPANTFQLLGSMAFRGSKQLRMSSAITGVSRTQLARPSAPLLAFNINRNRSHTQASFTCGTKVLSALAKCICIAFVVCLSGCESVKPLLTRSETVEVRIPIPVSCVALADVPAIPKTAIPLDGDIKQLAAGAAADVLALEQYAARADALLTGCAR